MFRVKSAKGTVSQTFGRIVRPFISKVCFQYIFWLQRFESGMSNLPQTLVFTWKLEMGIDDNKTMKKK